MEGWTPERAEALLRGAAPLPTTANEPESGRKGRRPAQRDSLMGLTEFCGLWFDAGAQAIKDTLQVLEARAANEGPQRESWRRVGFADGRIFIDLCDSAWRVVEVTATGWDVREKANTPFIRSPANRPLPVPEAGEQNGGAAASDLTALKPAPYGRYATGKKGRDHE